MYENFKLQPKKRCVPIFALLLSGLYSFKFYRMIKHISLFLCSLFIIAASYAQTGALSEQAMLEKLDLYAKAHPSNLLFVHTDKTIYTNNETVWFSAYLVKSDVRFLKEHTILSVSMVREENRKVYLQDKYIMQDGLSFGSLSLPDSIPPGNYRFLAFTNVLDKNGQPLALFTQPLTIKSITQQDFAATLRLLDTVINNGAVRVEVNIRVKYPDPKKKQRADIKYSVGKGANQSAVLNGNSYIISVPVAQLTQSQPVLLTSVKYNNEIQYLSVKLPEIKSPGISVRFFPEGGNLADGLESTVGWEARTSYDLPVALSGTLYQDDLPIDTITTNSYGIGTFKLKPQVKSRYNLKISSNNYLKQDTVYKLPEVTENGIVMHLSDAIVNDTLRISLFSKRSRNVQVLIHNYRKAFASFNVRIESSGSRARIALPAIAKGIATVTILDEMARPVAERLFFARYNQKITTAIHPDKPVYEKKKKVNLKITLTDETGKPVQGIVSIAVVQDNRVEHRKSQDIESYVFLEHELGSLPQNPAGRGLTNKDYLENILLIKGWRRYTWPSLINSSPEDTVRHVQYPIISAKVKYYNKPLKKPVTVSVINGALFNLITTEIQGFLILEPDKLLTTEGGKIFLSVNHKIKDGYNIEANDPFVELNQKFSEQIEIQSRGIAQIEQNNKGQELKGLERVVALKEVIISADKKDKSLFGTGRNACGDYVCMYGWLNCPNHFGGLKPEKGKIYHNILYNGCIAEEAPEKELFKIKGIYTSREYYGVNMDSIGLLEPQFLSTLFWKPGVIIGKGSKETEFSFFTGDITGKFRIVVQGVGEKDMIFGEAGFSVK